MDLFPDGDILVGGQGGLLGGQSALVRLNPDGTRDSSFTFRERNGETHRAAIARPDGSVVADGPLFVEADGTVSTITTFQLRSPAEVSVLAQDVDGGWVAAGQFDFVDGLPRTDIARVDRNGNVDPLFVPSGGVPVYSQILSLAVQADGKVVVGGVFSEFSGTVANGIVRLNRDGSLDGTFATGSGFRYLEYDAAVSDIEVQSDGSLLVGGNFSSYNGTPREWIARLMPGGELDTTYPAGSGLDGAIAELVVDEMGRAIVSGSFTSFSSRARPGLMRLNVDGSLDETFSRLLKNP